MRRTSPKKLSIFARRRIFGIQQPLLPPPGAQSRVPPHKNREAYGVRGACSRFSSVHLHSTAPASWTHSIRFARQFIIEVSGAKNKFCNGKHAAFKRTL